MMSETARHEWRDHWKVVLGTFIAMGLGYGGWSFTQSQFVEPLQQAFGWSRGQIAFAFHFSFFTSFVAPLFGRLIDRIGVKPVLSVCLVLVGLSYVTIANTGGNYTLFLIAYVMLVTAGLGTTGIAFTRAVASRFSTSRGTALAISRIGYSLCGAFMPIIVFHVIANHGWQAGYYLLAAAALIIALPVVLLLVSDKRDAIELDAKGKPAALLDWRLWAKLLSNPKILLVCLAAAFTYGPVIGILSQLQPMLTGKGLSPELAAEFGALLAISVVAGTLTTGLLVDRIWAPAVGCVFTLLPVFGIFLLLPAEPTILMAAIGLVLIGLAQGAEIDVVAYIIAKYFGMKSFAAIYGLTVLFIGVFTSVGAMAFAFAYDKFGSYNQALIGAAVLFALGSGCYLLLGRYPKEPGVQTS
jgi:predicted MFS family arabinose efflux permease